MTGLTQGEFAAELGLTRFAIADYERDVRAPRRAILMAVALRAGVPLDWLEGTGADLRSRWFSLDVLGVAA